MDEQDGRHSYRENNPVTGRHESTESDVELGSTFRREVYSDALVNDIIERLLPKSDPERPERITERNPAEKRPV